MDLLNKLKYEVQQALQDSRGSHDWDHTERVYTLARHIAEVEEADMEIVSYAAVLHDIARHLEDTKQGKICHAEEGAGQAAGLLIKYEFEQPVIDRITHCIISHRFRNNHPPLSLEAKVLFDADKLDSIGAIGLGRAFLFAGEIGAKLHNPDVLIAKTQPYTVEDTAFREYRVKLQFIKGRMLTGEGKRLARQRHAFMEIFFAQLDQEIKGVL